VKIKSIEIKQYFNIFKFQRVPAHIISYTEWGEESAAPVLCLHGLTRNGRDFDFLAKSLSQKYRVICPDMPGRGNSSWFENSKLYNYVTYYKDVLALLNALKIQHVAIVGTSMGGLIGMYMAAKKQKLVSALVLNDIGPEIPLGAVKRINEYASKRPGFDSKKECKEHLQKILKPFGIQDGQEMDHMVEISFSMAEDKKYYLKYDPKIASNSASGRSKFDMWEIWQNVICPELLIRGENSDILEHSTCKKMQILKPNLTLAEFKGVGHAPALLAKEQIDILCNGLKKVY